MKIQVLVIVYGADSAAPPDNAARVWFNQVVAYFTQGCLAPLMVRISNRHTSAHVPQVPVNNPQAILPTVVVVLVALKLSPIDNGGLSGVIQTDGATRLEGGSASDTIAFHHSTVRTSDGQDMEINVGGMSPGGG